MNLPRSSLDIKQVQEVDQIVGLLRVEADLLNVIHARGQACEDVEHRPRAVVFLAKIVSDSLT